ncbi:MAG TPA: plastocyanin/azurin family copper-binding protein [Solirubrobacteraceae bacterium]
MRALLGSFVAALLLAAPASADQQINAEPTRRYANPNITIAQGEKVTFHNADTLLHDVTSTQTLDGKALFASPLTDPGKDSVVDGTQYLTTGSYPYICSLHPDMTGTITVSSEGTPVPRPGAGGGAELSASAAKLSSVRKARRLRVTVTGAAGADAIISAKATVGGKRITLAKTRVTLTSGDGQRVDLRLTTKARSAIRRVKRLTVTFKVTVLAPSGSQTASAKRTYR